MKIKTADLQGAALDWAVGVAHEDGGLLPVAYSTDWQFGGPIIEREDIALRPQARSEGWFAHKVWGEQGEYTGPTPLIAAMRCYVASKLGDEVTIPNELMEAA